MMPQALQTIHLAAERQVSLKVDRENRVIRDVSVMTAGEARGHGFELDRTSLDQTAAGINSSGGVKVRLAHPDLFNDGTGAMVGTIRDARREGGKVRGDLHVGKFAAHSRHPNADAYLFDVAEESPQHIGLSIVFTPDEFEKPDNGKMIARIREVHAVDVVDEPAANPAGMFSNPTERNAPVTNPPHTGTTTPQKPMDVEFAIDAALKRRDENEAYRIREIRALGELGGLGEDWIAHHVHARTSGEDAKRAGLERRAELSPPLRVSGGEDRNLSSLNAAIEGALRLRVGDSDETLPRRVNELRQARVSDMMKRWLDARHELKPGMSFSTIRPRTLPSSALAHTTARSATGELVIHILEPFRI